MSITRTIKRMEQIFDAKMERFFWHHPCLGMLYVFVGLPLFVLACVCLGAAAIAFPTALLLGLL